MAKRRRQRGKRDRAVAGEEHRHVAAAQRVVNLAARLQQATARFPEVLVVRRRPRLARAADDPRLDPERIADERRERLGPAAGPIRAVGRAAPKQDQRDVHQRPVHFGSRFSKKARTPSWMSSVVKATESCPRRYSSASSRGMSSCRYIASFPSFISTGDLAA